MKSGLRYLSADAKSVFTGVFGFGATLSFSFVENCPTAQCNAALTELEMAGAIVRTFDRDKRAIVYSVSPDLSERDLRLLRVAQSKMTSVRIAEPREAVT